MDYLKRIEKVPNENILWNIPEQKQGIINVVGGNLQNFRIPVKIAEFMGANYPIKVLNLVLPDLLKDRLPALDNLVFLSSTDSGSLANETELINALDGADYNLLVGDLSKNAITAKVVQGACVSSVKPILATRDAVDLLTGGRTDSILMNGQLVVMGSLIQIQKIFQAVYYPKILTMSQSFIQVAEALHKFTLSYPTRIITLHDGQVLMAENGITGAISLEKTNYSPLSLWNGELAAKIVALNLYNPNRFLEATATAVMG